MAVKDKSFWSTTSGVVTGIAGTVTGIVALVGVAAQVGWIGGEGGSDGPANVQTEAPGGQSNTTVAGGRGAGGGSGSGASGSATATPVFTVDPTTLTFEPLGERKRVVKVENSGTVALTLQPPAIEGSNRTEFSATAPTCTRAPVNPGRTCEVEVTFAPSRSGSYRATLVIQPSGNGRAQEVALSGNSLL